MPLYKGIPFNGGMASPSGAGAQNIVLTCTSIIDFFTNLSQPGILLDATSSPSLDFTHRAGYADSGINTLDWENCVLHDLNNQQSVDWLGRVLYDTASNASFAWDARVLFDPGGATIFQWSTNALAFFNSTPANQQTGGAISAGPVYTATEQGMLNTLWTALQAYGLLT